MKAEKISDKQNLFTQNGVLEFHRIEFKKTYRVQSTNTNLNGMGSLLNLVR